MLSLLSSLNAGQLHCCCWGADPSSLLPGLLQRCCFVDAVVSNALEGLDELLGLRYQRAHVRQAQLLYRTKTVLKSITKKADSHV
jgi:hypothetical protein